MHKESMNSTDLIDSIRELSKLIPCAEHIHLHKILDRVYPCSNVSH